MRAVSRIITVLALGALSVPALAAWGDVSYDANPAVFDLDKDAQFDLFGLLSSSLSLANNVSRASENFESGYVSGQQLSDWRAINGATVRFGFGIDLDQIRWQSSIGRIDAVSSQFGLLHPHGTYGNAPGVTDSPRNYVADHYFLTENVPAGSSPSAYFVVQFQSPVSFVSFAMIHQTGQPGGPANMTLWRGDRLPGAVQIASAGSGIRPDTVDGDFTYFIAQGPADDLVPNARQRFDFVVLSLAGIEGPVGFDNFTVGVAPVPEPETYGMLLAGLGLLALRARRRSALTATANSPIATPRA